MRKHATNDTAKNNNEYNNAIIVRSKCICKHPHNSNTIIYIYIYIHNSINMYVPV